MTPDPPTRPVSYTREQALIHLLTAFVATGLFFMVLPGTVLGVWNLFAISTQHRRSFISSAWIQAHGHAQLFGWVGSFILGIGFYSIPNLRRVPSFSYGEVWLCYVLWVLGVSLRWFTCVYEWHWKILLPLSSILELLTIFGFLTLSLQGHRLSAPEKLKPWAIAVITGTVGLLAAGLLNTIEAFYVSGHLNTPAFPGDVESRFLILAIWGFVVPVVWGFTAHWIPIFLGLRELHSRLFLFALAINVTGVITGLCSSTLVSALIIFIGVLCAVIALRFFEPTVSPAKTTGVHKSFPYFCRVAYLWLLISSVILIWANLQPESTGIAGAGRHALTVGFIATMIFSVAPRILPAFFGRKQLYT